MTKPIRILHLEDNPIDAEMILAKLESDQIKCELINVRDRSSFEKELSDIRKKKDESVNCSCNGSNDRCGIYCGG